MWATTKKGFTLIELLIVIAVVAILSAGFLLASVQTNLQRARDGKRQSELEAVRSALEIFRSENGGYPEVSGTVSDVLIDLKPDFITDLPSDPSEPSRHYYYSGVAGCLSGLCKTYELCASLEKTTGGGAGGCIGTNNCGADPVVCNYRTQNP